MGNRTFVGFGFGPIQSALFLFEAYNSRKFSRYVVAEIDAALVNAVRAGGGSYRVNIARRTVIDTKTVEGVEIYNPRHAADRAQLVKAVSCADEIATALPSVKFYDADGPAGAAMILAEGFAARSNGKPSVIYAAENHNHAAEILMKTLAGYAPPASLSRVQAVNTVIGKMSGLITDPATIAGLGLATITPATPAAILVEEFNRILISRIALPGFVRGIEVFVEKDDLLPFEEAKLYGHNAIHALIGYLADARDLPTIAAAAQHQDIMAIARRAFMDESGAALIARYAHLKDPLFTSDGYREYADDLLDRMTRPKLNDTVSRVIRDPVRKLGYDDRIYGTMRLALRHGIKPVYLARGAAAAVISLIRRRESAGACPIALPPSVSALTPTSLQALLHQIWQGKTDEFAGELPQLTWDALRQSGQFLRHPVA